MKKNILLLLIPFFFFACKNQSAEEKVDLNETAVDSIQSIQTKNDKKDLVVIKHGEYFEYYPGKQKIKIRGFVDDNNQRIGKWSYYNEAGREQSVMMYEDGKKHGFSVVRYPNGSVHYSGEYVQDEKVGEWKFYDQEGNVTIKNY